MENEKFFKKPDIECLKLYINTQITNIPINYFTTSNTFITFKTSITSFYKDCS